MENNDRAAFEKLLGPFTYDYTKDADAWGQVKYAASHIESMFMGFKAAKAHYETREEEYPHITAKWKEVKPSYEAQKIRSSLLHELDSTDFMPDWVVDVVDIAIQLGMKILQPRETREVSGESAYREGWEDGHRLRSYEATIDSDWKTSDTYEALMIASEEALQPQPSQDVMSDEEMVGVMQEAINNLNEGENWMTATIKALREAGCLKGGA
jgi:hypothetical protein